MFTCSVLQPVYTLSETQMLYLKRQCTVLGYGNENFLLGRKSTLNTLELCLVCEIFEFLPVQFNFIVVFVCILRIIYALVKYFERGSFFVKEYCSFKIKYLLRLCFRGFYLYIRFHKSEGNLMK